MFEYELDEDLEFFINLSLQFRTSYDQLKYVQDRMIDPTYETDYKLFFNYYFIDGYNELILRFSLIYDNDIKSKYNFFNYLNKFLKNIDVAGSRDGFFGIEKYDDVKNKILQDKKILNSYRTLITTNRSKNIAHIDKDVIKDIVELNELEKPILTFFEIVHNLAYYKYRQTRFYTFSYLSEIEEMMGKLRK